MTAPLELGVAVLSDGFGGFVERVRRAEAAGFDRICFGDNQAVYREAWVSHAVMAMQTERAGLWMTVSNPLSRHPAVTAAAASSLAELSGGRFALALGTGYSSLGAIGRRSATVQQMADAVDALRALWRGEEISWEGRPAKMSWPGPAVPIGVAAAGPRTLRLAAERCDEVIVGSGIDGPSIDTALALLQAGTEAAGRPAGDLKTWFYARCSIAPTREEALEQVKTAMASSAAFSFPDLDAAVLPPRVKEGIRHVQRNYSFADHSVPGPSHNTALVSDPELLGFLVNRFALAGTAEDVATRLAELRRQGVERVFMTTVGPDAGAILERFAEEVMPELDLAGGRGSAAR